MPPNPSIPNFTNPQPVGKGDDVARAKEAKKTLGQIEADGRQQYFTLQMGWSKYLKWALSVSIAFQAGIICWVGAGWLEFEHHEVFLNTVSGEIFLQIAGMCLIIVRCLFPAAKEKAKGKKGAPKAVRLEISGPTEQLKGKRKAEDETDDDDNDGQEESSEDADSN